MSQCKHMWIWSLGRFVCRYCYETRRWEPPYNRGGLLPRGTSFAVNGTTETELVENG